MRAPTLANIHNGSFREDPCDERYELIRETNEKLRAYNDLVIQHAKIRRQPPVPRNNIASLRTWLANHGNQAVLEVKDSYLLHSEDLFAMAPKIISPLRRLMEHSVTFRFSRLWAKASTLQDKSVQLISDERNDIFINVIVALIGWSCLSFRSECWLSSRRSCTDLQSSLPSSWCFFASPRLRPRPDRLRILGLLRRKFCCFSHNSMTCR